MLLQVDDRAGSTFKAGSTSGAGGPVRNREAALACLLGQDLAGRFHAWCGRSGRRYLTTIYDIDRSDPAANLPDLGPAVLMAVTRDQTGTRAIAAAAVVERGSDWTGAVARLQDRADEWHVHLLAEDRSARVAARDDLYGAPELAIVA